MRFSAAIQHVVRRGQPPVKLTQPPRPGERPLLPQQPASPPPAELPPDLDQRVRLLGEW